MAKRLSAATSHPPLSYPAIRISLKKTIDYVERDVTLVVAALVAATSIAYSIALAAHNDLAGFPLDDSWIYQTFARNLVRFGDFVYSPGDRVAAMTSPMWTLWLSLGYTVGVDPRVWAYTSGLLCFFGVILLSHRLALALFPGRKRMAAAVAVLVGMNGSLAWAAFSGMETLFFTLLSLALIYTTAMDAKPLVFGLLAGAILVTRPEGLLLIALAFAYRMWKGRPSSRLIDSAIILAGFAIFAAPYVILNWSLSGSPLPTTFYAKQALYSPSGSLGYVIFIRDASEVLFAQGPGLLLIPGLILSIKGVVHRREAHHALPLLWLASLFIVHGWRIPQVFHHGRYLMPLMPIVIIYGVAGIRRLLIALQNKQLRKLAAIYPAIAMAFAITFWATGAKTLAADTAFINDQQVRAAKWLAVNTPEGTVIATHDIGAIGYFANRPVFDTAGLISPETVPYIRQPERLLAMAEEQRARYLAFFPNWYPSLVDQAGMKEVLNLDREYMRSLGFRGMLVYELNAD